VTQTIESQKENMTAAATTTTATTTKIPAEKQKVVNGVNLESMYDNGEAIRRNPATAKFNFRAKNHWISGGHNTTIINEFDGAGLTHKRNKPFVYEEDEPPVLLGSDQGANPVEFLLVALAGCLTTSLVYNAAARGIRIDHVEATLGGDLDVRGAMGISDKVRNGYESIQVKFKVKGDAPKETLRELVELAQKRSPVFDAVSHPTPVHVSLAED
jgi:uncharacterized OsmC-like protein